MDLTELTEVLLSLSKNERIAEIEKLVEGYINNVGERPNGATLEYLADLILYEELTDKSPDKIANNEYPILSDRQINKRRTGARRGKNKHGVVFREVPLFFAKNVAIDGQNYAPPIRKARLSRQT